MTEPGGRPLRLEDDGPPGDTSTPVYSGFPVLDDVEHDGFRLGMITDWEAEPDDRGDAFVVAPDGSRCGLDWEVSDEHRFEAVIEPDPARWGVWYVTFPHPMDSRENARRNLAHVAPGLRERWEAWREAGASRSG